MENAQEFQTQLEKNTANTVTGFLLNWAERAKTQFLLKKRDRVALSSYIENFNNKYGVVKIFGIADPIPLENIYVNVKTIRGESLSCYKSISDLEKEYLANNQRTFFIHSEIKMPGMELVNNYQYINILGPPGSGKSTFLKRIAFEALLPRKDWKLNVPNEDVNNHPSQPGKFKHNSFPIYLELKRIDFSIKKPIQEGLRQELNTFGFSNLSRFIDYHLEEGNFLLILDGFDEISKLDIDTAVDAIRNFVHKYRSNRFIISCRTAFYKDYFELFSDFRICEFDDRQIDTFINNWSMNNYTFDEEAISDLSQLTKSPEQLSTSELAITPLLLALICIVYSRKGRLPTLKSLLFRQAFEILLQEWAASKRVHNEDIYKDLNPDLEAIMLAEIANYFFVNEQLFFQKSELLDQVGQFMSNISNSPKTLNRAQILEAIEIQQGLFVERAKGIYSFSHL